LILQAYSANSRTIQAVRHFARVGTTAVGSIKLSDMSRLHDLLFDLVGRKYTLDLQSLANSYLICTDASGAALGFSHPYRVSD